MEHKDFYKVMGLAQNATPEDVKLAYRRLARKYHPDLNKEHDAEERFKTLGEAYDVLKDPEKRAAYDQYLANRDRQGPAHTAYSHSTSDGGYNGAHVSPEEWFESLFGERAFRSANAKGEDWIADVNLSLEEAYHGTSKELSLPSVDSSTPASMQTLRVKIPAGVHSGQQLRLSGQGQPSHFGGVRGDLILTLHIQPHPYFNVMGSDVYLTLPIAPWEAALGGKVMVPTLDGNVELKIPPDSQGGQTLRLKKRGFPGATRGDQYVLLKIVIPQPTTDKTRALYQTMAEQMPFNPRETMGV